MENEIGAYIRSELIQGLLAGLLLGLGYWALGIRYPLTLALVGVLVGSIPLVGAPLAATLPLLIGLSSNPSLGIVAALSTGAIFLILELVVEPHFFNRHRYSSMMMVLGMIILAYVFGLLGLILAPLLVIAIQVLSGYLMRQSLPAVATKPTLQITDLEERLAAVQMMASEFDEPLPLETASMIKRLEGLVKKVSKILPAEFPPETPEGLPKPFNSASQSAPLGGK
jgi:hypothetical protein